MHVLPEIGTLFTLAVTFCVASRGANALVTERNDLMALEPTVPRVNTLKNTIEARNSDCQDGYSLCRDEAGCCPTGGYCCSDGGFPA